MDPIAKLAAAAAANETAYRHWLAGALPVDAERRMIAAQAAQDAAQAELTHAFGDDVARKLRAALTMAVARIHGVRPPEHMARVMGCPEAFIAEFADALA